MCTTTWVLGVKPGLLQEQQVFLTNKPCLACHMYIHIYEFVCTCRVDVCAAHRMDVCAKANHSCLSHSPPHILRLDLSLNL